MSSSKPKSTTRPPLAFAPNIPTTPPGAPATAPITPPPSTTPEVTPPATPPEVSPPSPTNDADGGAVSISERHAELLEVISGLADRPVGPGGLNCHLTAKQNSALEALFHALMQRMAKLASGQYVRSKPDALDWLLEAIGNVPINLDFVADNRTEGQKLKEAQEAANKARGISKITIKLGELGARCDTPVRLKEYCDYLRNAAIAHGCTVEIFGHDDWKQRDISITGRNGKPQEMIQAVTVKPTHQVPAGFIAKPEGAGARPKK